MKNMGIQNTFKMSGEMKRLTHYLDINANLRMTKRYMMSKRDILELLNYQNNSSKGREKKEL